MLATGIDIEEKDIDKIVKGVIWYYWFKYRWVYESRIKSFYSDIIDYSTYFVNLTDEKTIIWMFKKCL